MNCEYRQRKFSRSLLIRRTGTGEGRDIKPLFAGETIMVGTMESHLEL
jgi:hypothetical protein